MIKTPNQETSNAINSINRQFEIAMAAADSQALVEVYTTSGSIMPPHSPIIKGSNEIKKFWQSVMDLGIAKAELTTVELDDLGDTVNEIGKFKLSTADGTVADQGKFIVVWKKENGSWLWHHDIWSSELPAK